MADLTLLLDALHRGEPDAAGALLAQVYAELRQLAARRWPASNPVSSPALGSSNERRVG